MAEQRAAVAYLAGSEVPGRGERTPGFVLIVRNPADIEAERLAREEAAMDLEDILTQAEEANAVDPVG